MKKLLLGIDVVLLLFCAACGFGSGSSGPSPTGNFSNASLNGRYVFQLTGTDLSNGSLPYREAGVFTADGNGHITSGTRDFTETTSSGIVTSSVTGAYGIGNDGTGSMTLDLGTSGTINFAITLVSQSKLYLIEADTFANAAGIAELQSSTAAASTPSGTFAFRMHSISSSSAAGSEALVGAFTVSSGAVSGTMDTLRGSVLNNNSGSPLTLTSSSSFSAPDSNGRGTLTLADSSGVTATFEYYIVDSNNIRFLGSDSEIIGLGRAEAQTGGPFSTASLSGNYVFGSRGDDSTFLNSVATVGVFTATGGNIMGGAYDIVQDQIPSLGLSFTGGSYTGAADGRIAATMNTSPGGTVQRIFWMVSPSRAFFLTNDSTKVEDGAADLQQLSSFTNSTMNGQFALVMDGYDSFEWVNRVGTLQWDGAGNLILNEAVNNSGVGAQIPGLLPGIYTVSSNGRAQGTISGLTSNIHLIFYMSSASNAYVLQGDGGTETIGAISKQP
jgi:hypothetical protein